MKKFFSITLAIYFLATSVGFGVNTHFCYGKAIKSDVQLTQHKLSCGMKIATSSTCATHGTAIKKKNCCENHFNAFQVDDDFQLVNVEVNLHPVFVATFFYSFLLPEVAVEKQPSFLAYNPPLVQRDLPVLHQSFLI